MATDRSRVAGNALAGIGAAAVDPLISVLDKENGNARWEAVLALGWIGAPAVAPLKKVARDGDERVRDSALKALERIGWVKRSRSAHL